MVKVNEVSETPIIMVLEVHDNGTFSRYMADISMLFPQDFFLGFVKGASWKILAIEYSLSLACV